MNDVLGFGNIAEQLGKLLRNLVGFERNRLAERQSGAKAIIEACTATRLLTQALDKGQDAALDGKINTHSVSELRGQSC
ncbi:MAG: hypothetical protein ACFB03_09810 [Paracoccaceae bacterium]